MTLSSRLPSSPSMPEALELPCTVSEPLTATSEVLMGTQMVWSQCYACSMTLLGMSTKEAERERDPSQSTSNLGTQTSTTSSSSERTMVRRKIELVTCSMLCGFQICSCAEWSRTENGPSCVPMNAQVSMTPGEKSSRNSMKDTKEMEEEEKL